MKMIDFSSRTMSRAGIAALAALFAASAFAPAHAASKNDWNKKGASEKSVLAGCANTAGCNWNVTATGLYGCAPTKGCFQCNGQTGKCNPTSGPFVKREPPRTTRPVNSTTASATHMPGNGNNNAPVPGTRTTSRH